MQIQVRIFIFVGVLFVQPACRQRNSEVSDTPHPSLAGIDKNPNQLYAKMLFAGTNPCDPNKTVTQTEIGPLIEMRQYTQAERLAVIQDLLKLDGNLQSKANVNTTMDVLVDDSRPDPWQHCYKIPIGSKPRGLFNMIGETMLGPDYSSALQRALQTGFEREDIVEVMLNHPQIDIDYVMPEAVLRKRYDEYFRKLNQIDVFRDGRIKIDVSRFMGGYPVIYSAVSSFAFGEHKFVDDEKGGRKHKFFPFEKGGKKYELIKQILERSKTDINYEFPKGSGLTPINAWARSTRDCRPEVLELILAKKPATHFVVEPSAQILNVKNPNLKRNALEWTILKRKWLEWAVQSVTKQNQVNLIKERSDELSRCKQSEEMLKAYGFSARSEVLGLTL